MRVTELRQKIINVSIKKIDDLWLQNSSGLFGLSVQKKIWIETGNRLGMKTSDWSYKDRQNYLLFVMNVGWYDTSRNLNEKEFLKGGLPLSILPTSIASLERSIEKNSKLTQLIEEIERLRQKYRNQQSGVFTTVPPNNIQGSIPIPVPPANTQTSVTVPPLQIPKASTQSLPPAITQTLPPTNTRTSDSISFSQVSIPIPVPAYNPALLSSQNNKSHRIDARSYSFFMLKLAKCNILNPFGIYLPSYKSNTHLGFMILTAIYHDFSFS